MKKHFTLKNLGWLLTGIVAYLLGYSGIMKVTNSEEMVKNLTYVNLLPYLTVIGSVELVSIGLLVWPKTSGYGALIISSMMSGAVAIHLSYMGGSGMIMPIAIGVLAWTAHCLRSHSCKLI